MSKISDSELEVMRILWEGGKQTSSQIIDSLSKTTVWSKTTIKTLLMRLVSKGVASQEKEGNSYYYEPLVSERDFKKEENQNFLSKLYQGSVKNMLLNFVEEKQLSKADLEKLLQLIDKE